MTAFHKPQPLKAALKLALYGPAGSGKTFTALLLAEGLALHAGKGIAYVDTEHGTAFYGQDVPQRRVHPDAFDFDTLYTKSISEVLAAVRGLDLETHGVLVIDSITHLWDSCKNAFTGKLTILLTSSPSESTLANTYPGNTGLNTLKHPRIPCFRSNRSYSG